MDKNLSKKDGWFKRNIIDAAKPKEIKDSKDCLNVKIWIAVTLILHIIATVLGVRTIFTDPSFASYDGMPVIFAYTLRPAVIIWYFWGIATMLMNIPKVFKSVGKTAKSAYKVGEKIEYETTEVSQVSTNIYKVTTRKDNDGDLFGFMGAFFKFVLLLFFYCIFGAYITIKKLIGSIKALKSYQAK